MTAIEKLDTTLKYIWQSPREFQAISIYIEKIDKSIEHDELIAILEKLTKEGYVILRNVKVDEYNFREHYFTTFDGKVFIEKNGYKNKSRNDRIELRLKNATTFFLIFGGVAAGVYYTVELLKMICW